MLNSLPEIQGRRIEAQYILGKSRKEIAVAENVSVSAVSASISQGLREMKRSYKNVSLKQPCKTIKNHPDS
jgi:RNA polymerase sigma-70 factor (ECF subfamily)